MAIEFKIENKSFFVQDDFIKNDIFTIKSSPRSYNVSIINNGNPALQIKALMDENPSNILFIDKNVYDLYFENLELNESKIYFAQATETFKTIDGVLDLVAFLEKNGFTKTEKLIAVGGGIIEDVAAFVGAAYKRGIHWVYYPTTLLSMCDSCIGGKTGINHHNVKNQLALFSAPREIIINVAFLKTLSEFDIKSGMGEILKLLVTGGKRFIDVYQNEVTKGHVNSFDSYKNLIKSSLAVKRVVVEEDEFEFNYRKSLNYGHTIGHAIEALSEYKIPHGQAVIMGMVIANKIAKNLGILNETDYKLTQTLAKELLGESVIKQVKLEGMDSLLKKDKKTEGSKINLIVITKLGDTIFTKIEIDAKLMEEIKNIINTEF